MVSTNVSFFFILCIALPEVNVAANWGPAKNEHLTLAEATVLLARRHFSKISTTVVIVEQSVHPHMNSLNKLVFEYILLNLQETVAVQLYFGQSEYQPWEYHIFIVDSAEAFREVRWNFPVTHFELNFRFLIILTRYTANYVHVLKEIFTVCYQVHVLNVNIILNHPVLGVCMYTYNLFTEKDCRLVQPLLYLRFRNGIESLKDVFPQKLQKFHGCPIRICARENPPMLTFSGDRMNPQPDAYWRNLNGIDGQLIKIISRALNFTIEVLPFPTERTYFDNHTAYGCFAELLHGNADIAIGGYSGSDPKRSVLSPSTLYHNTPVVFIVQGGRNFNSISRLATPFSHQLWYIVGLFFVCCTLFIYKLQTVKPAIRRFIIGERTKFPLLNFLAVFLGYPITQMPRRNFARYVLMLWLTATMIIRNAYQGSLYDSIRMDRFVKIPKGYEELLRWNYKFLVTKVVQESGIFPENRTIVVDGGPKVRFKFLETVRGKYVTIAHRDNFGSYMQTMFRNGSELKMIDEAVYMHQTAMYFSKHSIYKATINKHLSLFSYSGITRHIAGNKAKKFGVFRDQRKGAPLKAISNDQLKGMYEIYFGMLTLAAIVFLLELMSVYCKKMRCIIERIN